jgi:hypothetical protein
MSGPAFNPIDYRSAQLPEPFKGWRGGSVAFGIIAIIMGVMSGCGAAMMPLGLMMGATARNAAPHQTAAAVSAAAFALASSIAFLWFGVGAIRKRRWTRPLAITGGTLWLLGGVIGIASIVLNLTAMRAQMAQSAPPGTTLPAAATNAILAVSMTMMAVLGVVVPGAYVWFFAKPQVRAMLEYFDPTPRWTDRCPIPVLGVVTGLVVWGGSHLINAPQQLAPVFGTVLVGPAAAAVISAFGLGALLLVPPVYRQRMAGWWGTLALLIISAIAFGLTAFRSDLIDQYRRAGVSEEQIQMMRQVQSAPATPVVWVLGGLLALGYLLYVRKYFRQPTAGAVTTAPLDP